MGVTGEFPEEGPYYDVITPTDRDMHLRPDPTHGAHRAVGDRPDRAGHPRLLRPRRQARSVRAALGAAPRLRAVRRRGLGPGGRARARVLPGRAQHRPRHAAEAADRPQRPRRDLAPGLFDRRGQRVRPAVRGRLRLLREDGAERRHADPRGRRRPDGDQLLPRRIRSALADEVFFFKRTVREAALRHDMFATFMAKPIAGEPGSAMHVHQSIVDKATGRNLFSNEDGTPSRRSSTGTSAGCRSYIAGGDGAVRALRQLLPAAGALRPRRRSTSSGAPTTARSASARRWRRRRRGASRTA